VGHVQAEHGVGDDLGTVDQQGVLKEQLVGVLELRPQRAGQQPRPQQPLELDRRELAVVGVQAAERLAVQRVGGAGRAEPPGNLAGRRAQPLRGGQYALQPHLQLVDVGLRGGHQQRGHLDQGAVAQVVGAPLRAVGQYADVALPQL
jgi:hypothetical protein